MITSHLLHTPRASSRSLLLAFPRPLTLPPSTHGLRRLNPPLGPHSLAHRSSVLGVSRGQAPGVSTPGVSTSMEEETKAEKGDPVVQYIVVRKDLVDTLKWPLGSVISQGCHAAVAAIWLFREDAVTAEYCSSGNLENMHKVTLEVKGETQLVNLAKKLEAGGVAHKLWTEQPENFPTCLATKPYRKSEVASFFKNVKLCR